MLRQTLGQGVGYRLRKMARPGELTIMVICTYPDSRGSEGVLPELSYNIGSAGPARCCRLTDVHDATAKAVGPCRPEPALVGAGERVPTHKPIRDAGRSGFLQHWDLDAAYVCEEGSALQDWSQGADQIEGRLRGHCKNHQVRTANRPGRGVSEISDGGRLQCLDPFASLR